MGLFSTKKIQPKKQCKTNIFVPLFPQSVKRAIFSNLPSNSIFFKSENCDNGSQIKNITYRAILIVYQTSWG